MPELSDAIKDAIADAGLSYAAVAELLKPERVVTTKDTVSLWANGGQPLKPFQVFALERVLDLAPGTLSQLDGYVPVEAKPALSVEAAIARDVRLSKAHRTALIATYRSLRKDR